MTPVPEAGVRADGCAAVHDRVCADRDPVGNLGVTGGDGRCVLERFLQELSGLGRDVGDRAKARELQRRMRRIPSQDPRDPGYRRLRYVRYADDHLLGYTGPRAEAEQIKQRLATFLRDDLKLELSAVI